MEWPFSDPKDLSVLTTQEVIDGEQPIRYVSHDVDDGSWQFHSGPDFDEDSACEVSLETIVKLEPLVAGLADLPLGVSAWRESPSEPWTRESLFPTEWLGLVEDAVSYVQEIHEHVKEVFELSDYERWEYFLNDGVFEWSSGDSVEVQGDILVAGKFTESTQTWTWSWADTELPSLVVEGMERVRTFGEEQGLSQLTEPTWKTTDSEAWQAACVVGLIMGSEYVYRAKVEDGYLFLLIEDLDFADEDDDEDETSDEQ